MRFGLVALILVTVIAPAAAEDAMTARYDFAPLQIRGLANQVTIQDAVPGDEDFSETDLVCTHHRGGACFPMDHESLYLVSVVDDTFEHVAVGISMYDARGFFVDGTIFCDGHEVYAGFSTSPGGGAVSMSVYPGGANEILECEGNPAGLATTGTIRVERIGVSPLYE